MSKVYSVGRICGNGHDIGPEVLLGCLVQCMM